MKRDSKKGFPEEFPQTESHPKGTYDLMGDQYYLMQGLFEKAQEISMYYGFRPIETPAFEHESLFIKALGENSQMMTKEAFSVKSKNEKLTLRPEYTTGIMRAYLEHGMTTLPQPVMMYSCGNVFRHETPSRTNHRSFKQFNLESIGSDKSISDALIIRTLTTILEEFGLADIVVNINSLGDRESHPVFLKDLVTYYKKHVTHLCKNCQENFKTSPEELLHCEKPECIPFKDNAPTLIQHLSPEARSHLKQVVQYLSEMGITYNINNLMLSGLPYYTRTVFEIEATYHDQEGNEHRTVVCTGGRYNNLAESLGSHKEVPAVGGAIGLDRAIIMDGRRELSPRIMKTPKIYFIQIGFEAKLKSLCIMEILRKARVPVYQSLSKDSLTEQLAIAEKMHIPYCMIFGQKEAMDNTVIMRNMDVHSQDTVKIDALADYIKHLK